MPTVRLARPDDLPALPEIEKAAGELFRTIGMEAIADDVLPTVEELAEYQRDGRAWVAVDEGDQPVGYLILRLVDGDAHVEQVSVEPAHARQGLGRALLDAAEAWAREHGCARLTLTTFADVPWNAPYYRRLGFEDVPGEQQGPQLREIVAAEAARGLTRWPRVVQRRAVRSGDG